VEKRGKILIITKYDSSELDAMKLIAKKFAFPTEGSSEEGNSSPSGHFYSWACVYNGFLWNYGGIHSQSDTYNDLWKFDLMTAKWTQVTLQDTAKPIRHAAAILYGNEMIISGGWRKGYVNEVVRINLDTLIYQVPPTYCTNTPIPPRNQLWSVQHRYRDKILVIHALPEDCLHLWEFDLVKNIWTMVFRFDSLVSYAGHFLTFRLDDHLYLLGVCMICLASSTISLQDL
jgi:hypothetical protein